MRKIRSAYLGSTPIPLSEQLNSHMSPDPLAPMWTRGGYSERNLIAFSIRFWKSWVSWARLPTHRGQLVAR